MREISGKAARIILEVLEDAGLALDPLADKLPVSLETLRTAARIDWNAFASLIERVEAVYGDRLTIDQLGERATLAPSFQFLRLAAQFVVSPRQLYTVAQKLLAPAMFANINVMQTWLPSGQLELIGELAPGYRDSEAVFRLCHANAIALPRLLDLPSSRIDEEAVTGRRGRLILTPPKSHTLAARLRRGARAVFAVPDAFRSVARQQEELEGSLAALRSSRQELRQLIERLPDGVMLHRDGIMSWGNTALLELLGVARVEDLVGRHVLDFMPEEDRGPIALAMANARPNQVSDAPLEYRVLRSDGSIRRVEARVVPNVELDGAPARLVVLHDVTEYHRLREQLALGDRMASLGRLAAGVAHEINNQPGGGFVAGLVMSVALVLQYMVSGTEWVEEHLRIYPRRWIAVGLLLALVTGDGAILFGYPFLTTHTAHLHLPLVGEVHVPSALFFDTGVFALVLGATMLILTALAHQSIRSHRWSDEQAEKEAERAVTGEAKGAA